MNVEKSALDANSRLNGLFRQGDFLDCYSVSIGSQENPPITEIAQRIFVGFPLWIRALLLARDLSVLPLGLKTTLSLPNKKRFRDQIRPGDAINFFPVQSIEDDEIVLGEDDRHLDFKISVRRSPGAAGRISLATWVRTHNRLGDLYLKTILGFHVLIVRSRLAALRQHYVSH